MNFPPPTQEWWPAPLAARPLAGELPVPGSKSETNRLLILAASAAFPVLLKGCVWARDTLLMRRGLEQLGAVFTEISADTILVHPIRKRFLASPVTIHCGLAGTVMRFLPLLAAGFSTPITFTADAQAEIRPMQPIFSLLEQLGARVSFPTQQVFPFIVEGGHLELPGEITVEASQSSQFLSALALAIPFLGKPDTTYKVSAASAPSHPHLELTAVCLNDFYPQHTQFYADSVSGAAEFTISTASAGVSFQSSSVKRSFTVEPDLSSAAPFIVAVAFCGGSLVLPSLRLDSAQPAWQFLEFLQQLRLVETNIVRSYDRQLLQVRALPVKSRVKRCVNPRGVSLDLGNIGELTPTLAAAASLVDYPVTFTGIGHLRGHETDRLAALENEFNKLGIGCVTGPDWLRIFPTVNASDDSGLDSLPAAAVKLRTYNDHRMATFAALMGLRRPVLVENIATTFKTIPDFISWWEQIILGETDE